MTLGYFGDRRLEANGAFLLERLVASSQQGISVRKLAGERKHEVMLGRFLRNHSVTSEEMVETAFARTRGLAAGRHVLAIQDTTSLRDDGNAKGHYLHATIGVDADDGTLLGVVGASYLLRLGKQEIHCNKRPFEEKESVRWLDATRGASALASAGARCVTVVADREGDIHEEFALRPAETELLIRCYHDRVLADGVRLYSCAAGLKPLGRDTFHVPSAPGRVARDAAVALFGRRVTLRRPKRNKAAEAAKLPPEVGLTYIEAREIGAPAGTDPLHWRLPTTHEATTLADVQRLVGWYRQRWNIEQVFRVMKTEGFDIEAVVMGNELAFENLVTATLVAAMRVSQMVHARDGTSKRPMTDVFEAGDRPIVEAIGATLEGRTARQKNPHAPGSLAYATWVCARLGGWTGYYGVAGPIVLFRGLGQFTTMRAGYLIGRTRTARAGPVIH
jgi:hypothetical protein